MAWVTNGTVIETATTEFSNDVKLNTTKTTDAVVTCDDTCCLAMIREMLDNGVKSFVINVYKKKTGELLKKGNATIKVDKEYPNNPSDNTTETKTYTNFKTIGGFHVGYTDDGNVSTKYVLVTTIPNFDDDAAALEEYIKTGNTSGAIKNLSTNWNLYIDGKSNPLYKLTWNCDGLKGMDTAYTTISIWVGTYNVFDDTFNDDDGKK